MRTYHTSLVLILCIVSGQALADPPMSGTEAFNLGTSTGQSGANSVFSGVRNQTALPYLPDYQPNAPESSYFVDGQGDIMTPGSSKKTTCANTVFGDPRKHAECTAINYLENIDSFKPDLNLGPNDPLFTSAGQVRNNIASILGSILANYQACDVVQGDSKTWYTEEECVESYMPVGANNVCYVERIVEVFATYTYQCIDSKGALIVSQCDRTLKVDVDVNQTRGPLNCTKGAQLAYVRDEVEGWVWCWDDRVIKYLMRSPTNISGRCWPAAQGTQSTPGGGVIGSFYTASPTDANGYCTKDGREHAHVRVDCNANDQCRVYFQISSQNQNYTGWFRKPMRPIITTYDVKKSWDNGCQTFEDRAR